MSIKVAEAIGADPQELPGDQTGNEILVRTFKRRSYEFSEFLRCTDRSMATRAASYATRIAACSQFGYSQRNRWNGARYIEEVGADRLEQARAGDFDCSSLVIECYRLAGCSRLDKTGYTGNIRKLLLATGMFEDVRLGEGYEDAQIGDVINAPNKHVLIVVSGGTQPVPAPVPDPEPEPVSSGQVRIIGDNVRIRSGPSKDYDTIIIAHKGQTYPYLRTDPETGWYWIETKLGAACITNKTRYTQLTGV